MGRTVTITLRDKSFGTITRSVTIPYTDSTDDIYNSAKRLLHANWNGRTPLRLLGVSLSQLVKQFDQLTLFSEDEKKRKLDNAIDKIRDKFGDNAIFRAKLKSQDSWEKRPLFKI
jgi:DNA polymerase-4